MSSMSMGLYWRLRPNQTYDTIFIEFNEQTYTREKYRERLKIASFKSNGRFLLQFLFAICLLLNLVCHFECALKCCLPFRVCFECGLKFSDKRELCKQCRRFDLVIFKD